MAYISNHPADFQRESKQGIVLAHADRLRVVDGGVLRKNRTKPGHVAVIIGGGSGHYPAFAGLVGEGLAHGAVMGNIFASPSSHQIVNVATAAENGGGVLLSFGNYTGDVMNFNRGRDLLELQGIQTQTLPVTDDVASAPASQTEDRRGIAGNLVVFKCAAAHADAGGSLDEVVATASAVNDVTRSLGIAFGGATLPGSTEPLFTVPPGRMAIGMGIHGEPGLEEVDLESAGHIAVRLWDALKSELPFQVGEKLVVILNGLGSVKYEELYLLYKEVHKLIEKDGRSVADVRVGEFATSFEMAGVSLTVSVLDDELFQRWMAPADAPAFSRDAVAPDSWAVEVVVSEVTSSGKEDPQESVEAHGCLALPYFERIVDVIVANEKLLGDLDAVAGDGDHGIGMRRGAEGALLAARNASAVGMKLSSTVHLAADGWEDSAGGTSGALWGAILRAISEVLPDPAQIDNGHIQVLLDAAVAAVGAFGASAGDRTMLDSLLGAAEGYRESTEQEVGARWHDASKAAKVAAHATASMTPRRGRAKTHSSKVLTTPDAGAISMSMIIDIFEMKEQSK